MYCFFVFSGGTEHVVVNLSSLKDDDFDQIPRIVSDSELRQNSIQLFIFIFCEFLCPKI